jgi:hypothetical protein
MLLLSAAGSDELVFRTASDDVSDNDDDDDVRDDATNVWVAVAKDDVTLTGNDGE